MNQSHSITYGRHVIDFTIMRRPRKTLAISVEPDCRVVIAAPLDAPLSAIKEKLRKRAAYVRRQQEFFAQYLPRTPERKFVSGATHLYLGRQYRLKVKAATQEHVQRTRGFIFVHSCNPKQPGNTRKLLQAWYGEQARDKFQERLRACLNRFPDQDRFSPKQLMIRDLRQSWGCMSPNFRLTLNRRLIEAPVDTIDYVITHELCHIQFPHHGPAFFNLLDQIMPDWQKRKSRLESTLS